VPVVAPGSRRSSGSPVAPSPAPARERFGRAQRILKSGEFVRVMRSGDRHGGRLFTLHHQPNAMAVARLGIAIGRRVSPRATDRNFIKRLIREKFRRRAASLPAIDIVFVVRSAAADTSRHELQRAVDAALGRLCH
jgi:ribonuclease P protein component